MEILSFILGSASSPEKAYGEGICNVCRGAEDTRENILQAESVITTIYLLMYSNSKTCAQHCHSHLFNCSELTFEISHN